MAPSPLKSRHLVAALLLLWLPVQASAAFTSSLADNLLTLTQTADDGAVTIDNNGTASAFRVIEGGTTEFVAATSLEVKMLDGSDPNLTIDLDNFHLRDLSLKLGATARVVLFTGAINFVGGNLTIKGGAGDDLIELASTAALNVGGDLDINLGLGDDTVDEGGNNLTITGDLVFNGVNTFNNDGTMVVVGNASIATNDENVYSLFDDDASMTIMGNFTYTGGKEVDRLFLDNGTQIFGDLNASLGKGTTITADGQRVDLSGGSAVGGSVTVTSGNSTNGASFSTNAACRIGGKVKLTFGDGPNTVSLLGRYAGSKITYSGGDGVDTVVCGMAGRNTKANLKLEKGADSFQLNNGTIAKKLTIDFGGGTDSYTDNYAGTKPFTVTLLNFP